MREPTSGRPEPQLTPVQVDAILEIGRTLRASIVTVWEAARPALVKIAETVQAIHDRDGCLPGNTGTCIVCHEPTGGGPESNRRAIDVEAEDASGGTDG